MTEQPPWDDLEAFSSALSFPRWEFSSINLSSSRYCLSSEGWGPVSPSRNFDFTPCFEQSVVIPAVVITFLVVGLPRLWTLSKSAGANEDLLRGKKSLFYLWTKLVTIVLLVATSIASIALKALSSPSPLEDQALYSAISEAVGISLIPALTFLNHMYTRRSSTILLTFYPVYFFATLLTVRTAYELLDRNRTLAVASWAISIAHAFFLLVVWAVECIGPEVDDVIEGFVKVEKSIKESPFETANVYSRLAFNWMTPLMKLGYSRYIVQEDMYDLAPLDSSSSLGGRLQHYWSQEVSKNKSPSLWRAVVYSYGGPLAIAAVLKVFSDLLQFAQPQILRLLLAWISQFEHSRALTNVSGGLALCAIMFFSAIAQTAILHQYFQLCFVTGSRVRAGLVMAVYRKSLVLSNDENAVRGDIVNLMSVDASRLQDLCTYGLIIVSGPFQIVLAFISLYDLLGWPSFVGVAVMILAVPINTALARYLKKLQEKQMKNRDARTTMMSELLNNIKSIKLYAWENTFAARILRMRNEQELRMLKKIGITSAFNTVFWSMIPLLVAFASFATAAHVNKEPLTADIIFPSIALFMLLGFPLAMFAVITNSVISAMVSISRLRTFLQSPELQKDARTIEPPSPRGVGNAPSTPPPTIEQGDTILSIRDGEFRWSKDAVQATLESIMLDVKMGELVGILGRVGCGKSSLLAGIIGEMTRSDGAVELFGSIAYAPQNPWIMSTTVRENITFFRHFDADFYNAVLEACALKPDLALLPEGDQTEVGEKGITLSGGQRARISLARCVYARADLYLLDDVLAAVDAHVARHLFDRVIGPNGLLARKARIVVTNSISSIREYDHIALIRRGIILENGTYDSIMSKPESELRKLITEYSSKPTSSAPGSGTTTPVVTDSESTAFGSIRGARSPGGSKSGSPTSASILYEKLHALLEERPPVLSRREQKVAYEATQGKKSKQFIAEASAQGKVKWDVYWKYLEAASSVGFFFFVLTILLQQAFSLFANLALRSWGSHNESTGNNGGASHYLTWYGIWVAAATIASLVSGLLLWVLCAIRSTKKLHDSMLSAVLRAPLGWFERTPQGRVLNLFSKDVNVVDETLPRVISGFFRTMATVSGILVVMAISIPLSLIAVIPLAFLYHRIMLYYLSTSRELKRLDAVSRSPIFAWFQETLGGLSTIRAFQLQSLFGHTIEMRSDTNLQAYLPSTYVNRWLAVRLEFIGALIVLTASLLSVATVVISGKIDSGLVGLVLSYALSTTQSLNWVIRSASDVEQNIVSVERIVTYVDVEPEAPADIPETKPNADWPQAGAICFEEFSMRYRPELEPVLRDITIDIKPGERIGVCGRTGAGKSSLILGLLRINEANTGRILIDGVDISKIGLHDLRSAVSIIPQEPQLFAGTIRQNVDVTELNSDEAIWHALDQVHLKETVSLLGGLDAPVREGGSSLSSGQRQLICFARALIRQSKILILDEATSAVDLESDQAIQQVLNGEQFNDVTRLTIAHRLHTIIDSDRILVLDAGRVAELDTPQNLLANSESIFASLAVEAGVA